ncbi:unnamed protein product [Oikopleura dioica]|uniref:Uncharacterized protein n=1 Tax=Oikopleura dioica TaxID=34765 RepID=E4XUK9_OIKDI|nr:unnamed protein product [Oikopleura dioica]
MSIQSLSRLYSKATVLTEQSSGVTSKRENGVIEVWLDRTLAQDDSRRMGKPVKGNSIRSF